MGTIAESIPRETTNNTLNPSIETSLKELVKQVALEEGLTVGE